MIIEEEPQLRKSEEKNLLMILIIPPMVLNIDINHTTHGTVFTTSLECGGKYRETGIRGRHLDGKTPHVDFCWSTA